MSVTTVRITNKVNDLLAVLDKDIEHLQETLLRLDRLRGLVIRRDDVSLARLLGKIQADTNDYAANESKRQSIRKELAIALGCDFKQMTLSRLEGLLAQEQKNHITEKKTRLRSLVEKLRKEHTGTVMLLSDCTRFNSLLLRSIFNSGDTKTVTYTAAGSTRRQMDTAFLNLQF
jgi:hypothetical protein